LALVGVNFLMSFEISSWSCLMIRASPVSTESRGSRVILSAIDDTVSVALAGSAQSQPSSVAFFRESRRLASTPRLRSVARNWKTVPRTRPGCAFPAGVSFSSSQSRLPAELLSPDTSIEVASPRVSRSTTDRERGPP